MINVFFTLSELFFIYLRNKRHYCTKQISRSLIYRFPNCILTPYMKETLNLSEYLPNRFCLVNLFLFDEQYFIQIQIQGQYHLKFRHFERIINHVEISFNTDDITIKDFLSLYILCTVVERPKIRHYKQMSNNTIFLLYTFKKF